MKIGLYYGSETGNSEMLCEDIEIDLGEGFDCSIAPLSEVDPAALTADTFHIFVTSTYGNGDLPTTALPFEDALNESKPDLSAIQFAIFGLGDMVFAETFNHGSKKLAEMLVAQGAKQVGDRGIHDASGIEMPEDIALPWVHEVLATMKSQAA